MGIVVDMYYSIIIGFNFRSGIVGGGEVCWGVPGDTVLSSYWPTPIARISHVEATWGVRAVSDWTVPPNLPAAHASDLLNAGAPPPPPPHPPTRQLETTYNPTEASEATSSINHVVRLFFLSFSFKDFIFIILLNLNLNYYFQKLFLYDNYMNLFFFIYNFFLKLQEFFVFNSLQLSTTTDYTILDKINNA